ncbi:hypothetical protein NLI96_g1539 [Meripilus lineatus]|uniref:Cytochrome c oxidase subunit 8, mitochondrial n=1 Tax=Meripilus lineatus TaxID=2056292 RepID=A0AAD5VAC1_9APHY|nr:hypothetical protein NLI96_g1539 [Physisporinus lineatus]
MSLLAARASLKQLTLRRGVRFAHSTYTTADAIPFTVGSKASFALKLGSYLALGFSIPFIAAAYQIRKSTGGA